MSVYDWAYYAGWAVLGVTILAGGVRLVRGPSTLDRMVALDTITVGIVGLMVLFSIHEGTGEYLEQILVVTALGFFVTIAFFYYLAQPPSGGKSGQEEPRS